jgi:hypothetical protein
MTIDLLKVWRSGSDLSEAWFHLAPTAQWQTFEFPEAARQPAKENLEWNPDDWSDADQDERVDLQKAISAQFLIRSPSASRAAQTEMKTWLLSALRRGAMVGLGYDTDAAHKAGVEVVPALLFDQRRVDWDGSSITSGNRRFSEIRIVEAAAVPVSAIGSPDGEKRRRGRPSNRPTINSAIDHLFAKGVPLNTMERLPAAFEVRHYLEHEMKVKLGPGYSTDVVEDAIVAKFGTRISNLN